MDEKPKTWAVVRVVQLPEVLDQQIKDLAAEAGMNYNQAIEACINRGLELQRSTPETSA